MKREKYIQTKKNSKGEIFYRIYIPYKNEFGVPQKPISENVKTKDYESTKVALAYACMKRDEYLKEIRLGTYRKQYPTVKELWDIRYDYFPKSLRTQQINEAFWKGGICDLSDIKINKLNTAELQKNVNKYALNHSQKQVSRYIGHWKVLFKLSNLLDIPVSDKTLMITVPKSKITVNPKDVTFSKEDFLKLIQVLENYTCKNERRLYRAKMLRYILLIGYYTGMRPAEIIALNSDDMINDKIKVWKSVGSTETEARTIVTTKTAQSIRYIPIHDDLKPYLEELKAISNHSPLITEIDGSLIDVNDISAMVKQFCTRYKINFHVYSLRHAFATDLIQSGTDPRTVQDLLGHASFSMSMDYARSTEQDRVTAINKIKK